MLGLVEDLTKPSQQVTQRSWDGTRTLSLRTAGVVARALAELPLRVECAAGRVRAHGRGWRAVGGVRAIGFGSARVAPIRPARRHGFHDEVGLGFLPARQPIGFQAYLALSIMMLVVSRRNRKRSGETGEGRGEGGDWGGGDRTREGDGDRDSHIYHIHINRTL